MRSMWDGWIGNVKSSVVDYDMISKLGALIAESVIVTNYILSLFGQNCTL